MDPQPEQVHLDKIEHAAANAAEVVAKAAAEAKAVINQAAATAIATLTTAAAVQSRDIEYIKAQLDKLSNKMDRMSEQYVSLSVFAPVAKKVDEIDDLMVRRQDFEFWRNLLVGGMLLSIAIAAIETLLKLHG